MAQAKRKIGILGGTFNPIHLGHLLMAQDAMEKVGLERVIFIPSATPPHKPLDGNATAAQRLAMVKLAIRGDERFKTDDLEIRRGGKSYAVDTVMELKRRWPDAEFHFVIGADSLAELHTWRESRRLRRLCKFVAVARPGAPARRGVIAGHACDISSSDIRQRIARRKSIRYLVPDAVARYIEAHQLYR